MNRFHLEKQLVLESNFYNVQAITYSIGVSRAKKVLLLTLFPI